jgi:hypothetical protein
VARRKGDWGWRRPPAAKPTPHEDAPAPREEASREEEQHDSALTGPSQPAEQPLFEASPDEELETDGTARVGPRSAALRERKRKAKVKRTLSTGMAAVLLAAVAAAGIYFAADKVIESDDGKKVPVAGGGPVEKPVTTLMFGTKESSTDQGALWIVVMSYDPETNKGSIIYVPAHTAAEVPGRGLQGVGQSYASGGVPLLLVSIENLLGLHMDRYIELSDKDAEVLFSAIGPLSIDVPEDIKVPAGKNQARLLIPAGKQRLSPEFMVRFLYTKGLDANDVSLGSRQIAFWHALLEQYHDEPGLLAQALRRGQAALGESDAKIDDHASFLNRLAALPDTDRTITTIPVSAVSAGPSELYRVSEEDLVAFIESTMAVPDQGNVQEIRVQILNGNGVPGIGQEVASRLVGQGFRVILSGNARRLNYRKTLIIAYGSEPEQIELAERAKDLLGVGEVQVSVQQQGIVDLTIVVGKDFLRT